MNSSLYLSLIHIFPSNCLNHSEKLLCTFVDGDLLYFIDSTYARDEYDLNNHKAYVIADMEAEILRRVEVSSIIKQKTDYFIGFKSSGLIQLKYMPDSKVKYSPVSYTHLDVYKRQLLYRQMWLASAIHWLLYYIGIPKYSYGL